MHNNIKIWSRKGIKSKSRQSRLNPWWELQEWPEKYSDLDPQLLWWGPFIIIAYHWWTEHIPKRHISWSSRLYHHFSSVGLSYWIITPGSLKYLFFYFQVNLVKNEYIKNQCEYFGALGWLLDCFTSLIKNYFLYQEFVHDL